MRFSCLGLFVLVFSMGCDPAGQAGTGAFDAGLSDDGAVGMSALPLETCDGFWDVSPRTRAQAYIEELRRDGVMRGYPGCSFGPHGEISREEIATALRVAFPDVAVRRSSRAFPDVNESRWSAASVDWAYRRGFVSGYPDGTFRPEDPVSREELASMLTSGLGLFRAVPVPERWTVSPWAIPAVERLIGQGGAPNDVFAATEDFTAPATRADAAAMLAAIRTVMSRRVSDDEMASALTCAGAAAAGIGSATRGIVCYLGTGGWGAPLCYVLSAGGVAGSYLAWCGARCPGYKFVCPFYSEAPPPGYSELSELTCRCVGSQRYCRWESSDGTSRPEFENGTCECREACLTP